MQAVKISLYQNLVNYRMEGHFGYVQTYPLPTPSMVRGMVHALIGATEYKPLRISIQGRSENVSTELQKVQKFDRNRTEPGYENAIRIPLGDGKASLITGVMFVDEVVESELCLHVSFYDENLNAKLLDALQKEIVVLGRHEDIVRVDFSKTKCVSLRQQDDDITLTLNAFLPKDFASEVGLFGRTFHLPFCYEAVSSFQEKRVFETVKALYISGDKELKIEDCDYLVDDDGMPVFFLEPECEA